MYAIGIVRVEQNFYISYTDFSSNMQLWGVAVDLYHILVIASCIRAFKSELPKILDQPLSLDRAKLRHYAGSRTGFN